MDTEQSVTQPERKWTEKDGVITFTVTSDGTTGLMWIERLKKGGFSLYSGEKALLKKMATTYGVTTEITVLKGELFEDELFSDNDRTTANIIVEAKRRGLTRPFAETACLIREKFTDEELTAMGLNCIIVMHSPIIDDSDGYSPKLLGVHSYNDSPTMGVFYPEPFRWFRGAGFAFAAQD
jgi:hypothetical protein